MFENENINLFEDKYNFSNININNYNIGKKEIEYLNNGKVEIPYDFILLRYEILEIFYTGKIAWILCLGKKVTNTS